MIEPSVCFEPPLEIVSEAVVPVELIDQLEDGSGAETMNSLDETLPMKTLRGLCAKSGEVI
jgi:hypothetical protein